MLTAESLSSRFWKCDTATTWRVSSVRTETEVEGAMLDLTMRARWRLAVSRSAICCDAQ